MSISVSGSIEEIGPSEAAAYLALSSRNRSLSRMKVEQYAADMQRGHWQAGALDPIRISEDNDLMDGQHRLHALIAAGVTMPFLVLRNVPEKARMVLDTGKKRTVSDELALMGVASASTLAVAAGWKWRYETFGIKGMWYASGDHALSAPAALETIERFSSLRAALSVTTMIKPKTLIGPGLAVWLYSEMATLDNSDSEAFWRGVGSGEALLAGDPPYTLRQLYLSGKANRHTNNGTAYAKAINSLKAWAAYRSRVQLHTLRMAESEPFPSFCRSYSSDENGRITGFQDEPKKAKGSSRIIFHPFDGEQASG